MRTLICSDIWIGRDPEVVFDFVTTFANWPCWYPATASVSSASAVPACVGDRTSELVWRARRTRSLQWTVTACDRPHKWAIRGGWGEGADTTIAYELTRDGGGTRFQRHLSFERPAGWRGLLSGFKRLRLEREARIALHNLKRVIETSE